MVGFIVYGVIYSVWCEFFSVWWDSRICVGLDKYQIKEIFDIGVYLCMEIGSIAR